MRVPIVLAALVLSGPAVAAGPMQSKSQAANCPQTTSYLADQSGMYRGKPVAPKKLNELPQATTYMAVLRRINGCEAPLTLTEYRNPRRR
jgi:hypothetical protein